MTDKKEQILALRAKGKTYNEIHRLTGASKGTIAYHCGEGQREKTLKRQRQFKSDHVVRKLLNFRAPRKERVSDRVVNTKRLAYWKVSDFQRAMSGKGKREPLLFSMQDVIDDYGSSTRCYLSGREIDLTDGSTFQFDHITPRSQGGDNSLSNLGIATPEANYAKGKLSVEEFVSLCYDVVENFESMREEFEDE